jgi:uncharacterized protein YbaR (Trm112 family)
VSAPAARLVELLLCPECRISLKAIEAGASLCCESCGRGVPIERGIVRLLPADVERTLAEVSPSVGAGAGLLAALDNEIRAARDAHARLRRIVASEMLHHDEEAGYYDAVLSEPGGGASLLCRPRR